MAYQIHRTVELLLDCLFPPRCVSCATFGAWWCMDCRNEVELVMPSDVPIVEGVDGLMAVGLYHDPRLRSVVHALKYRGGFALMSDVAQQIEAWAWQRRMPWADEPDLVVQPLIGSPRRIRERGFDQARVLAQAVASLLAPDASVSDLLVRADGLGAQAVITDHELRAANVSGLFDVRRDARVPESVLLVDDVITSGSTMREAARVLREAGVAHIYGFALALGK